MPQIDELIDRLGQANFISTRDLNRGYWQVPMTKEAKAKTALSHQLVFSNFMYIMPFGSKGSPATFQRLIDSVIQGMQDYAADYLDDLIILANAVLTTLNTYQQ